jgi:hypothetical protein
MSNSENLLRARRPRKVKNGQSVNTTLSTYEMIKLKREKIMQSTSSLNSMDTTHRAKNAFAVTGDSHATYRNTNSHDDNEGNSSTKNPTKIVDLLKRNSANNLLIENYNEFMSLNYSVSYDDKPVFVMERKPGEANREEVDQNRFGHMLTKPVSILEPNKADQSSSQSKLATRELRSNSDKNKSSSINKSMEKYRFRKK